MASKSSTARLAHRSADLRSKERLVITTIAVAVTAAPEDAELQRRLFDEAIRKNNINVRELIQMAMRYEGAFTQNIQEFLFPRMRDTATNADQSKEDDRKDITATDWGSDDIEPAAADSGTDGDAAPTAVQRAVRPKYQRPKRDHMSGRAPREPDHDRVPNYNIEKEKTKTSLWSFVGIPPEARAAVNFDDWYREYEGGEPIKWTQPDSKGYISCMAGSGYQHRRNADGEWEHQWFEGGYWVSTTADRIAKELLSRTRARRCDTRVERRAL